MNRYVLDLPFGLSQTNDQDCRGGVRAYIFISSAIANMTRMFLSMFDVSINEMGAFHATLFSP